MHVLLKPKIYKYSIVKDQHLLCRDIVYMYEIQNTFLIYVNEHHLKIKKKYIQIKHEHFLTVIFFFIAA